MRAIGRLDDQTEIGAWLLMADPDTWVAASTLEGDEIEQWKLDDPDRAALIRPGDPCVLWVVGAPGSDIAEGLWAIGEITGQPDHDNTVEIDVQMFGEPIPASAFSDDPRFSAAEILSAAPQGNPLVLTPDQYAVIEDHLDSEDLWPDDPELDALLDDAEDTAIAHLEDLGWSIEEREDPPTLVATKDEVETEVFLAIAATDNSFVLGVEEFDELLWDGEGALLVMVSFGDDDEQEPQVIAVQERWVPSEANYDRRTQLYRS